ncbi:hypothetical protein CLV63_11591 [Murinocardiopsis flavida]|uniref:Uncharacterized protein n=1 Tax=Murinocardiopsis flavida TaxID=645275 RepID=A0A2P8DDX1_9ACTN|nr:hypothetical protein [Murinocardiopsis flavida]PSK95431.1 hypothetical protein CLV63_11591 [Murinocardiopsis flavida]
MSENHGTAVRDHDSSPMPALGLWAAGAAVVLGGSFALFWARGLYLVPPKSVTNLDDPDYLYRVPFSPLVENVIGVAAVVLFCVGVVVLARATARNRLDAAWWIVVGLAAAAGLITGFTWAVYTAPTIGANIGAGFMSLVGTPVAVALLLGAAGTALYLRRRARRHRS